jgi:hypothetical protein
VLEKMRQPLLARFWLDLAALDGGGRFGDRRSSCLSAILVAKNADRALAYRSSQTAVERVPDQTVATPFFDAAVVQSGKGRREMQPEPLEQ